MAYKRILGVLTVRDGCLVKSYGYARWRPAGGLVTALRNLDRWGADEIVVLDISRRSSLDTEIMAQIKIACVSTPLAYGGGIRSLEDVEHLMELGCDRFIVENLLFDQPELVSRLAELAGRQALIASLPILNPGASLSAPALWRPNGSLSWLEWRERLLALPVSEYFITSVGSEGATKKFPMTLPSLLEGFANESVIWFGGLDLDAASACLIRPETIGVAWGNPFHETELALPNLRRRLVHAGLRPTRLT